MSNNAQQIIPRLWLGGYEACAELSRYGVKSICVLERPSCNIKGCTHMRVLGDMYFSPEKVAQGLTKREELNDVTLITKEQYREHIRVDVDMMVAAQKEIDRLHGSGEEVLVHCAAGVERSPLTIVLWLMRHYQIRLTAAYGWVKMHRPIVQDRSFWLGDDPNAFIKELFGKLGTEYKIA